MKVLNRPMFRYGGPIKEGIMSGIQEPRQRYQEAGQVFKNVENLLTTDQPRGDVLQGAVELGIASPYKRNVFKPYMKKTVTKPTNLDMSETDQLALEVERIDPAEPLTELQKAKIGKTFIGTEEYRQKVKELEALEEAKNLKSKADGTVTTQGKSPFAYTLDEVIKNEGKTDSGDNEPKVLSKKEKVNSILEGLGYDRAQKNALYDAMIKAGQRISRTGLGAENLVSDVIAETSQSYDKPEKLREAANLMQVQQDLKLDQIEASKTNTTEQTVDFLMSDKGGNKTKTEALDIVLKNPRNDDEAYDKSFAETKGDVGRAVTSAVNYAVERELYDKPLGIIDTKNYDNPKEFFEDKSVYKGPGNYILGGTVINIDSTGKATTVKKYYTSKKSESFLSKFGIGTD